LCRREAVGIESPLYLSRLPPQCVLMLGRIEIHLNDFSLEVWQGLGINCSLIIHEEVCSRS
ncbi:MAG: hypothetical protein ABSD99_01640, partial [Candidatus Bathyarchaeia archaeon]